MAIDTVFDVVVPDAIWVSERPIWFSGVRLRARTTVVRLSDEVHKAGREAVAADGIRLLLGAAGLGLMLVAVLWNLSEGASRRSWLTSALTLLAVLLSVESTRRERARKLRIACERLGQTRPTTVCYALDASGLTITRHDAPVRLAWRECLGYEEAPLTFALYFDRQLPELVLKRAFAEQDLPAVRALLVRCAPRGVVGRRAMRRMLVLCTIAGIIILAFGVGLALTARH